jgi:carboxypeptidase C (cathepsin A)
MNSRKTKLMIFFLLFIYTISENTRKKVEDLFDGLYTKDIYSGYIDTDISENSLFYIYTPSQSNPDSDPLLLWLNGGPGCSSLIGLFTEIGPVISPLYSYKWKINEYSWNKDLNVLFIESPAGVGFTKSKPNPTYETEEEVAHSLRVALENFFNYLFTELKGREFYISGESYAGVYIPYLSMEIINSGSNINLKGVLIGNPLTFFLTDSERSVVEFGFSHGLVSKESFQDFENKCFHLPLEISKNNNQNYTINDNGLDPRNVTHECNVIRQTISDCFKGLDFYGIYRPCPNSGYNKQNYSNINKLSYKYSILKNLRDFKKQFNNNFNKTKTKKNEEEEPENDILQGYCENDAAVDILLNDAIIQKKLGVNDINWSQCSDINYTLHESISFYENFVPEHKNDLKVWVMSGDTDAVLSTLGTLRWINYLNSSVSSDWEPYKDENEQVCGMKISYENGLTLITAKGAGHMIPQDKPKIAEVIKNLFIKS